MLPDFRVRQRDYLLEISRALTQELDPEKLLARILRISIEMLAGQAGLIALKDGGWRVAAAQGIPPAFLRYLEPILAEDEVSELNPEELNRMLKNLTYTASMGLLNGVGLPLVARHRVIGFIFIFRNYPDIFSANDKLLLQAFADQAAIAVHNAQLYSQLKYENQRLDALLDSAADGILILMADHTIERCNLAFERMIGIPRQQIQGHPHSEIIRWARRPEGLTLEEAEAGGWPLTSHAYLYVEGDLARPDQSPLPVGITYAPLLTENGKLRNIIVTIRDITKFRTAEEIKNTFVSIISHELKTPVALIKGYVSTLRREDVKWDRQIVQDSLAIIEEEADRLASMIEDLLDASRLQAGSLTLNLADIHLPTLARRLAERFQTQTQRHTIVLDFPDNFPIILADENRLAQVLSNLISNAIKYAPGGEIRIHGEVRPEQVIITVSDEGSGIDPADIPYVFDRFYRSEKAARKTKGAGLGLYLSKAIVEAHGGRIWVDPKPGAGARICFSLPRK
ncbi:MAG: ATP-binding protein [Anaerolineales bacterium]|nr:ATP-binding protein [Anaerolineales bacterium]MDW8227123.1 ATP-binding protein [Anaerolineales bacterium]